MYLGTGPVGVTRRVEDVEATVVPAAFRAGALQRIALLARHAPDLKCVRLGGETREVVEECRVPNRTAGQFLARHMHLSRDVRELQ